MININFLFNIQGLPGRRGVQGPQGERGTDVSNATPFCGFYFKISLWLPGFYVITAFNHTFFVVINLRLLPFFKWHT